MDPGGRCRGIRRREDGSRYPHPPYAGARILDGGGSAAWIQRRRHVGMGNEPPPCRRPIGRCPEQPGSPDLRHLQGHRRRAPRPQCRRYRSCPRQAAEDHAFQDWVWTDPDRTDRLARDYNDRFNNIAPRKFDGSHLKLPGASGAFTLYGHQKRGIWRIIADGSTYLALAVGAGKTMTMAAAIIAQRRLGLIDKAMLVVPGHCLAQAAREFLALYTNARILVADETNFTKDKRACFLSRPPPGMQSSLRIWPSASLPCPRHLNSS